MTADLPTVNAYLLSPGLPTPGTPTLLRHSIATTSGAGILTRFPSTTRFRLALGTDSPCADERCARKPWLSAWGLFTPIIVTHVSIRACDTSSRPIDPP